jgi:hypothetical protein
MAPLRQLRHQDMGNGASAKTAMIPSQQPRGRQHDAQATMATMPAQGGRQRRNGNNSQVTVAKASLLCPQGRQRRNYNDGNSARAMGAMLP